MTKLDIVDGYLKYAQGKSISWGTGVTQHAMLDAFLQEVQQDYPGYKPPAHKKRTWERMSERLAAELRAYGIKESDWPAFVHSACKQNRQRKLDINGLQSLEWYVKHFKGADRSRYKQGEYADFWED